MITTFYLFLIFAIIQKAQGQTDVVAFCVANGPGTYPDPQTQYTTCKGYIVCKQTNNAVSGNIRTCSGTRIFNPSANDCVNSGYVCPQPPTTPTTIASTTSTSTTTPSTTTSTTTAATTTSSTTTQSTTTVSTTTTTVSAPTYCTNLQPGLYADPGTASSTCKGYIRCYLNGGVMTGQRYTCAGSSIFNPNTRNCVGSGYTCPGSS